MFGSQFQNNNNNNNNSLQCGPNEVPAPGGLICVCKTGYRKNLDTNQCELDQTDTTAPETDTTATASETTSGRDTTTSVNFSLLGSTNNRLGGIVGGIVVDVSQKSTLSCETIAQTTYDDLIEYINNNTVNFGCNTYPCDGLTDEQQSTLKSNGWTLLDCPCADGYSKNDTGQCVENTVNQGDIVGDLVQSGVSDIGTLPALATGRRYESSNETTETTESAESTSTRSGDRIPGAQVEPSPEADSFNTTGLCGEGLTWDSDKNECVTVTVCGENTTINDRNQCVAPPQLSCPAGYSLQGGQCVSQCGTNEYWNSFFQQCRTIPSCDNGTTFNPQTNKCEPNFQDVCGPGTERIGNQCVGIVPEPPAPVVPPSVKITINLPPDSGNEIVQNPDPDNSSGNGNQALLPGSAGCKDVPPTPTLGPRPDNTTRVETINSTGKHLYVLRNKVGNQFKYINEPFVAQGVDDEIRGMTGYFWYFDYRANTSLVTDNSPLLPVYRDFASGVPTDYGLTRYFSEYTNDSWIINADANYQEQKAFFKLRNIANETAKNKIRSLEINKPYEDQVFYANVAKNKKELGNSSEDELYIYENDSKYNYYISSYEKLLKSPSSPETNQLPNFYLLGGNDGENENNSQPSISSTQKTQFYDDYALSALDGQIITEKIENIFFESSQNLLNTVDEKYVPFYNKINFRLEQQTREIYNAATARNIRRQFLNIMAITISLMDDYFLTKNYAYRDKEKLVNIQNKELHYVPYESVVYTMLGLALEDNNASYLRKIQKTTFINNLNHNHRDYQVLFQTCKELVNSVILSIPKRSFQEILQGKECYSETLLYKIEKYEEGIEDPVQNIWLTNDEKEDFDYIDTQVKYGIEYTYVVKSYKYVLGSIYNYTKKERISNSFITVNSDYYQIESLQIPEASIVVTEYARISGIVIDKPPPAPEIDVIPYKDNSEKVLVLFNPSTVEYKRTPVAFTDSEAEFYERVLRYQNSQDGKITFGGDDKTTKYLVYRIEHHPSSYEDFYNALYTEIDTECNCTTAEYVQDLEANKKYYYVFRSVDVHGHLSYPTQPFLVELINEAGTTFLDFRGVDFIDKDYKSLTKPVKRFIHIKPNLEQSMLKVEENNLLTLSAKTAIENAEYDLGQEELTKRVWDKNFKLKIKSKNTNKEVNIKFKFVKKQNTDLIRNLEESCE